MSADQLIVFLRAPRLGTVKTRLAAVIGEVPALAAYRELLAATLAVVAEWERVELRFTPDDARAELTSLGRPNWSYRPQGGGDLGDRLIRSFAEGFAAGARRIVVIGSDCPWLTAEDLSAAWLALETADVVVGPADDGGYWLIGLRRPQPELFRGVGWGGATVLAETQRRAELRGLQSRLLRQLPDVDTAADWQAYQRAQRAT